MKIENWNIVINLIDVVKWPGLILIFLIMFREQIIDLFKSIKKLQYGSIVAELEKAKDEALATIEQLRDLAVTLAVPIGNSFPGYITNRVPTTSFYMPSTTERLEEAGKLYESLIKLSIEPNKAREIAVEPIVNHIRDSHIRWLQDTVNEIHQPDKIHLSRKNVHENIFNQLKEKSITIDEARMKVRNDTQFTDELTEWFNDLQYFDENHMLRRPDIKPWD